MKGYIKALILTIVCLAILIPFASEFPDGLETVMETFQLEEQEQLWSGLMPEYTVPLIENQYLSTLLAGFVGIFLVLGAAFMLGVVMQSRKDENL